MAKEISAKIIKYVHARSEGKSKKASALFAGYSPSVANKASEKIESQRQYATVADAFKVALSESLVMLGGKGALPTIADALSENIVQSNDRGARNKSIELALEHLGVRAQEGTTNNVVVAILAGVSPEEGGDQDGRKVFTIKE